MTDASYVVFHRGGRRFALPLPQVRRIAHPRAITPVPRPAPGVLGLLEARGVLFTLIETPLPPPADNRQRRILLVQGESALGFFVDGVEGVRDAERPGQGVRGADLSPLSSLPPPESRHVLGAQILVGGSPAWTLDIAALAQSQAGVGT